MNAALKSPLDLVRLWVALCATLCAGTWLLSAARGLNAAGYAALGLVLAAIVYVLARGTKRGALALMFRKIARRRRRLAPVLFFAMCAINAIGGAFSSITLGDTISYRLPRIMHWLAENRWHWIHTGDERMNVVATNAEFLWAPILMLCKKDWALFPVNLLAYLLLPGLVFSFFRMAGVRGRVAWWWMWLLPGGYIYAMQAASTGTDAFSATAALAAVVLALKGFKENRVADLWLSILGYGFMTGIKQVTLPLSIIWIVPMIAGAKMLLRRPVITGLVTIAAIAASALPIAIANTHYTGNWKGFAPGNSYEQSSPLWGIVGNLFAIPAQNLQPPIFPMAEAWNVRMDRFVQTPFGQHFKDFERFAPMWRAPSEMNAGLGFGLMALLLATAAGLWRWRGKIPAQETTWLELLLRWTPFIAAAAFMAKSALMQNARYMAPYYPFLLPSLLALPANALVVRQRWWRALGIGTMLLTIGLLSISRQRPLFPPQLVDALAEKAPNNRFLKKVQNSYAFTRQDKIVRTNLTRLIPPDAKKIGYAATLGFKEFEIWRSAPGRRVGWITTNDVPARAREFEYVLVEPTFVETLPATNINAWLSNVAPAELAGTIEMKRLPEEPPQTAYVVKMR